MSKNNGDRLESLIQYIYQTLSNISNHDINVKIRENIVGKSKVTHNIDVYYEFELNHIIHKVIFECKNWKTPISKEKILAFKSILDDIPNSAGVIVSTKGFQRGAKGFADFHGIKLISGDEKSLLNIVILKKLGVVLPNESISGEPFFCIMAVDKNGLITGEYIQFSVAETNHPYLVLFFSKKEAMEQNDSRVSVVRGIDKKHLEILCNLSEKNDLKLAIKSFLDPRLISVEPMLIREYFL